MNRVVLTQTGGWLDSQCDLNEDLALEVNAPRSYFCGLNELTFRHGHTTRLKERLETRAAS